MSVFFHNLSLTKQTQVKA